MLGELESGDLEMNPTRRRRRLRSGLLPAVLESHAVVASLFSIAAASIALRVFLVAQVHGPFIFMDELGYEQLARSIATTGHLALFGKSGLSYSPLYPVFLAPIYALTSSAQVAYEWVKVENAVLMSLSVFPVYGIARFVLSRARSVGVAALSVAAPLMFYTGFEMSENLAYPLFLVAVWAMLRTLREPSAKNDALLLGSILAASAARAQHIVLLPAAMTAILLVALIRPASGERRFRAAWRSIAEHWLLFVCTGLAALAALARTAANGGSLPLAGRYSGLGNSHAGVLSVLEIAVHHLAELDLATGVVPFAGSLLAVYVLARSGFPREGLVFGAVAASAAVWVLLLTAYSAASFDTGVASPTTGTVTGGALPRIHERYLIYLAPFFLVAMVAALRAGRPRVRTPVHLAVAAAVTLLPLAIPFSTVVNYTIVADTFGLQFVGQVVRDRVAVAPHATTLAVAVAAVLALGYLYALLRPRPSFAIVVTVAAFLIAGNLIRIRIEAQAVGSRTSVAARPDWVDRVVGSSDVVLVGGKGADPAALEQTAFNNFSIARVYRTCNALFAGGFGEQQLTANGDGTLGTSRTPVRASYAVVPASFHVRGRVLARDRKGGIELVAPSGSELQVPPGARRALLCAD